MRSLFWWPTIKSHAWAAGAIIVAMVLLALLDVPRFPLFRDYVGMQASPLNYFIYALLISGANYVFLFQNARGDYLAWRTARRPIIGTHLALSVLFPAAFAAGRYFFKDAPAPDLALLVSGAWDALRGKKLSDPQVLQWTRVLRVFFVGEAGLTSVLLFSGLFKPPPADTLEFKATLDNARPLVTKFFNGKANISSEEVGELKAYLKALTDGAPKILGRRLEGQDRSSVDKISKAAAELQARFAARPSGVFEGLRTTSDDKVRNAVKTLEGV
jgi:hypothetical protein